MREESELPRATSGLRRKGVPLATLVLLAATVATFWLLPADAFDRGMRSTFSFLACILASVIIGIWFFGFAGAARRTRASVGLVLLLLAIGVVASVRRVEFSGDMEPTFDFRWQESRESRLEGFLEAEMKDPLPVEQEAGRPMPRVRAEDSPQYRGQKWDGIVDGPALARNWEEQPPKCLWRHPCGEGYASFAVVGDLAVTIEQRGDNEVIVCYDLLSGHQHWTYAYPALFNERVGGPGPRATPTIHQGRVYSLGATGDLVKLDLAANYKIWKTNILAENGSGNLDWGMSGSPLVYDGRVIVNPGTQQGSDASADILCVDANKGDIVGRGGKAKASYCSPMLATLAGKQQILVFDAAGLVGFDPDDASELWRVAWTSDFDINAAQPVVLDDTHVIITSQAGCALLELSANEGQWTATEKWRNRLMKCSYANPIAHNGYLYGLDEGIMACLDLTTGKRLWKKGRYGHGQILLSGDLLLVLSEKGELALVEATPEEYRELSRIQAIEGKTWNNPVLVGGRALVRNHLEMACYELPLANPNEPRDAPQPEEDGVE
jgi:outer membrane protein assembly factor BamB